MQTPHRTAAVFSLWEIQTRNVLTLRSAKQCQPSNHHAACRSPARKISKKSKAFATVADLPSRRPSKFITNCVMLREISHLRYCTSVSMLNVKMNNLRRVWRDCRDKAPSQKQWKWIHRIMFAKLQWKQSYSNKTRWKSRSNVLLDRSDQRRDVWPSCA